MSTQIDTIQLEIAYTDHNERTYKIPFNGEITTEKVNQSKQKIRDFNAAIIAEPNGAVAQTFLSSTGAPAAGIKSATLVRREEDVIYSG